MAIVVKELPEHDRLVLSSIRRAQLAKRRLGRAKRKAAQARSKQKRLVILAQLGWECHNANVALPIAAWTELRRLAARHQQPVQAIISALLVTQLRTTPAPSALDGHWRKYREAVGDVTLTRHGLWLRRWGAPAEPTTPEEEGSPDA